MAMTVGISAMSVLGISTHIGGAAGFQDGEDSVAGAAAHRDRYAGLLCV